MLFRIVPVVAVLALMLLPAAFGGEADVVPGPKIVRIEPSRVDMPGGTEVVIHGSGFSTKGASKMKVIFGGEPSGTFKVVSDTEIQAVTPRLKTDGPKTVEVISADGLSARFEAFRYGNEPGFMPAVKRQLNAVWSFVRADRSHIIYVLGLMSVMAVAWAVRCLLALRESQVLPDRVRALLLKHISGNDLRAALDLCGKHDSVLCRIIQPGLRKAGTGVNAVRDAIQSAGSREAVKLQQKISYLSNVGVIAPMLGLLGTVWGMILAFQAHAGTTDQYAQTPLLMAAVSTAMNTTAAGMVVGIPAMALYFYLRGRTVQLTSELEVAAEEAIHAFEHRVKD